MPDRPRELLVEQLGPPEQRHPRSLRHQPRRSKQGVRVRGLTPGLEVTLEHRLLVDVDRVEVARRARVAHGEVAVGHHGQRRDLVAGPHHAPRTMFDQVAVQTVSSRWLSDTDSNTK